MTPPRHYRLMVECVLLFIGGPIALLMLRNPQILFGTLWVSAGLAWWCTRHHAPAPVRPLTPHFKRLLLRFAVLAPCLLLLTRFIFPHDFLSLPRTNPKLWILVLLLYPLLSVWPQEVLYRHFLFTRYATSFNKTTTLIFMSAITFGFAHILFLNPIAIALCLIGGFLFAQDYAQHRSLRLACLEHSLYGCLLFTAGLGRFFYTGTAWHH
ncbi:CPBP family glutamic-type intramembrane protease [Neokomagataea anthophila]|uniref:CPBP family intramembrane metalloprotease n=1 Tax=Neokomagataea anthophila TaxID=2826925 RepID=A0ABS5E908_9PROT|nr:CPBP family glutamic-type intramembrane protease [Neokomagataea anthophila]MBR0560388.1 CPBP family intramembrane metalloprotease [Neokomagataea anthophila]